MERSLKFGHAVGLTLDNGQIIVTVNEKKSNQYTEFDMVEDMVHMMQETMKQVEPSSL